MELDEILNGQAPGEAPVSEEPAIVPEEVAEEQTLQQPRDEHGRFAPKGENEQPAQEPVAAPPAAQVETTIPVKAQIEERRKRQEAEERAERAERELAQYRSQPQAVQQPAPAPQMGGNVPVVFDDEYAQTIFEQAVSYVRQEMAPQIHSTRMDLVRDMVRTKYADYDEVEDAYRALIQQNPLLHAEVMRQPNPVEYAYQQTKKHLEFQQRGATNVDELRAQLRAEIEAELRSQTPAAPAAPQTIPSSLADAQSARGSAAQPGPPTLDQILGRK